MSHPAGDQRLADPFGIFEVGGRQAGAAGITGGEIGKILRERRGTVFRFQQGLPGGMAIGKGAEVLIRFPRQLSETNSL